MRFAGMQKLTLLDYPGKVAATVFAIGCPFRCPFCHNPELVLPDRLAQPALTEEDVLGFLQTRQGLLDALCVSGGEPTLHAGLPRFLSRVKALGFLCKLDTNGGNPAMLKTCLHENLVDFVSMDIKNAPEKYGETAGILHPPLSEIRESISLLEQGTVPHEFRTTVVDELHTVKDITTIAANLIPDAETFILQAFRPGDTLCPNLHAPSIQTLHQMRDTAAAHVKTAVLRGV